MMVTGLNSAQNPQKLTKQILCNDCQRETDRQTEISSAFNLLRYGICWRKLKASSKQSTAKVKTGQNL